MYKITEKNTIKYDNVISYKFNTCDQKFISEYEEIKKLISDFEVIQIDNALITIFSVDFSSFEPVFSTELIVPVDRKITIPSKYTFISPFKIDNVLILHSDEEKFLNYKDVDILIKYMTENNIIPVTSRYDSVVKDSKITGELKVKSMYIGVI